MLRTKYTSIVRTVLYCTGISYKKNGINKKRGECVKDALLKDDCEKRVAEDIWLNYLNRYLFECGTISEKEYKKMIEKIAIRKAKLSHERSAL